MSYEKQIDSFLKNSGGLITTTDCIENRIPTVYLSRLVKKGKLSKVKKGIYITEDGSYDELYFFQYQYKKAIFSYETALYLLGETDNIPWVIDATIYSGYKFTKKLETANIHYVKKSVYDLGIIERKTMFGNIVRTYSYERTLCDFILNKKEMDIETYIKIIRSYSAYRSKNTQYLYDIAIKMGIENKVQEIMEIVYE